MSVEDDNKALIRRLIDFLNKNNSAPVEGFDEFFDPDYVYHNVRTPEVRNLTSVKNNLMR